MLDAVGEISSGLLRPPGLRRVMLTSTIAATMAVLAWVGAPAAQEIRTASPSDPAASANPHEGGFFDRDVLSGDWGGDRSALESHGIQLDMNYIGELLGNPAGGVRTGAIYEGRVELFLNLDLNAAAGWSGATFHVNAYQIHGRGLSANDLGNNLLDVSNIEAVRATRLFDLWLQQKFLDGAISVRAGQIAADDEFIVSQYAANLVNATFGWPGIASADLPSGGPAYPLATPGIRVALAASDELSLSAALFNGDSAGPGSGNPQRRDLAGTNFELNGGVFAITEADYAVNQGKDDQGLAATYKLGAWYHSGEFVDPRIDNFGTSLASPTSNGVPAKHQGNFGIYGVVDQMFWRDPNDRTRGVAGFLRVSGSPSERNLIDFYADGGLNYLGPLPGRRGDVLGLGIAYARISEPASALDRDTNTFTNANHPIRDFEMVLELSYKYQVAPWWMLQPDLQFLFHPGGHVSDSSDPTGKRAIGDAVVLGMRTTVSF